MSQFLVRSTESRRVLNLGARVLKGTWHVRHVGATPVLRTRTGREIRPQQIPRAPGALARGQSHARRAEQQLGRWRPRPPFLGCSCDLRCSHYKLGGCKHARETSPGLSALFSSAANTLRPWSISRVVYKLRQPVVPGPHLEQEDPPAANLWFAGITRATDEQNHITSRSRGHTFVGCADERDLADVAQQTESLHPFRNSKVF